MTEYFERRDLEERTEDMAEELRRIRKLVGLPEGTNDEWSTASLVENRIARLVELLAFAKDQQGIPPDDPLTSSERATWREINEVIEGGSRG